MRSVWCVGLVVAMAAMVAACEVSSPVDPGRGDVATKGQTAAGQGAAAPGQAAPAVKAPSGERGPEVQGVGQLVPDEASTATRAPTAEDLKRYTQDLGESGELAVRLETSMGTLTCTLYEDKAPLTVANFVGLARGLKAWQHPETREPQVGKPFYDGLIFHRVIPDFMLQGGDPLGKGVGGPGYQIPDEFGAGLTHNKGGLLSMANRGPSTGGSQFFVTEKATPWLDGRHAIFGECDDLELIKKIARVPRNGQDRPDTPVTMHKLTFYRQR